MQLGLNTIKVLVYELNGLVLKIFIFEIGDGQMC